MAILEKLVWKPSLHCSPVFDPDPKFWYLKLKNGLIFFLRLEAVFVTLQRVPTLRAFWDLEKTVLHEICVSVTVGPYQRENPPIAHT